MAIKEKITEVKLISWYDDRFYKIRYVNDQKVDVEDYFPSVTTKLGALDKPFLKQWYGEVGIEYARSQMNQAADRGSRIHWAWNTFLTGGAVLYDPPKTPLYTPEEKSELYKRFENKVFVLSNQDEMYDFLKLKAFFDTVKPDKYSSEQVVYNIAHREAGTTDNVWTIALGKYVINGKEPIELPFGQYVVDVKTGKQINDEHFMQVACYVKCCEAMGMGEFSGAIIAHTSAQIKSGIEGFKAYYLSRAEIEQYYQDYRDIAKVWERQFGTRKPTIRQLPGYVSLNKNV